MMCDEMQGFLLARPLSAEAFGDLLTAPEGSVEPKAVSL
jgi:EAL domain-containing protein (putative c-di-GMP-specific phosphodiesterase class I)